MICRVFYMSIHDSIHKGGVHLMAIQRHEIEAWLGPAFEEMTEEQVDRVQREAERIEARYPGEGYEMEREAALTAVTQYLLGEASPAGVGDELATARLGEMQARARAQQVAVMAVQDGMSEAEAARQVGLDRMTVRKALGK
jgi:hypothetical protein